MFRLISLFPRSLGLRVFSLYAISLVLTVVIGLGAFYRLQFSRHIEDAELSAVMMSQVLTQTVADSAVIGDYDTIDKTLRKALTRSPFAAAAFIDLKGGAIRVEGGVGGVHSQAPGWLADRVARQLEPINSVIAAGGRDYGVLRLTFAVDRVAAELWDLLRGALLLALGGLLLGLTMIGVPMYRWLRNLQRIDSFEEEIRDGRIDPNRIIDHDAPIEIRRTFEVLSRTAASLQAQREKADVTLHAVADGVMTLDAEGVVVYANPAAGVMLGRPGEQLIGASIRDLFPGLLVEPGLGEGWRNRRIELSDPSLAVIDSAAPGTAGMTGRVLETSLAPIVAGEGQAAGFVLACHDITEAHRLDLRLREEFADRDHALQSLRKLLQRMLPASGRTALDADSDIAAVSDALTDLIREREASRSRLVRAKLEAEASNRAKGEFLANMSHEIRTPMNAILGLSELVLSTPLNEQQREHLRLVKSSADSLLGIINDILDFSKIEAGRMDLEAKPFEMTGTVAEIVSLMQPQAAARGLNLSLKIDESVPRQVVGDSLRIGQVLKNLIGNALKFTEQGGVSVVLKALPSDPGKVRLRFDVIDTGIGIEAEKLQGIFEAFEQADSSITRRFGGTGLGLTISRRLALTMGGDLRVESVPGQGSTFTFELETAVAVPRLARTEHPVNQSGDDALPLRLLLVEDNLVNQKLAVALLEQAGHKVVVASDGQQGIDRWREGGFDTILMDVQMPVLDGLEATRQIRQAEHGTGRRVPILAMTANAMTGDRERCLASGMDDYLAKPFRRADLLEALVRVRRAAQATLLPIAESALATLTTASASASASTTRSEGSTDALPREAKVDYAALLLDVDPEIVEIIGAAFLSQYEAALADIDQAARQGDPYRLKRAAHSLKGLFRTFNAEEPARLTVAIEQAAVRAVVAVGKPAPIDISDILAELRLEGAAFCAALAHRMSGETAHVG